MGPSSIARPNIIENKPKNPTPSPILASSNQPSSSSSFRPQSISIFQPYTQLQPPCIDERNRNILYIDPLGNANMPKNEQNIEYIQNINCIEYEPTNNDLLKDIEGQNSNDIQYKLSATSSN